MYTIPTFEAIRAAYLRDVKNLLPDAATDADSDHYIRATAEAAAVEGLYQHQLWIAWQVLPDTSDPEYLERHAALRGISRKPAMAASGDLVIQGTPGAVVPAGENVRHVATGLLFATTAQGIVDADGRAVVPVAAARGGVMPVFAGEPVLFVQAPEGVLPQAGLTLSGGVAAETAADPKQKVQLTPKPVRLVKDRLVMSTNGATVLGSFLDGGTTVMACLETGR